MIDVYNIHNILAGLVSVLTHYKQQIKSPTNQKLVLFHENLGREGAPNVNAVIRFSELSSRSLYSFLNDLLMAWCHLTMSLYQ